MTRVLARLSGVVRRFGSVEALAGADLEVLEGEVHAVLGENGAGKTTLLGILGGILRPNEGTVEIDGTPVTLSSPGDAWARGVGLVHQHFMLVPALSVLENLALGRRSTPGRLSRTHAHVRSDASRLMERTGLDVPLDVRVESLSVGQKQRVEILRALLRDPRILVLDEPTAALAPAEVASLFALLRDLAAEGRAVVLVAHKIDEVLAVADRVTVLRRGRTTLTELRASVDATSLVRAIVGGEAADRVSVWSPGQATAPRRARGQEVAALVDARARDASGRVGVDGVSLAVGRGEILGIAGVDGNGQRELALLLAGRLTPDTGSARIPDGVGFIPQDRTLEGLIGEFDLTENVALALHADARFGGRSLLRWRDIRTEADRVRVRFGIVAPGIDTRGGALSGGNQQRLVVGRELLVATDLLVAENPTRGLDVSATAFVHGELRQVTDAVTGPGVVLISSDLDEVLALSDRVLVLSRGRVHEIAEGVRTREGVGALMLGGADAVA
ncbi:MAG: ATP-binding cassette domain-containing protein [Gemmatimonadetes bacterium]|nr:ATP-binding cassette domain-containing protein [Gemmatimonadota bacterium]